MNYRAHVRYHTQDKAEYCGAAVAMMLLEHLGIGGGVQQEELYATGTGFTKDPANFFIDPSGLKDLLNKYLVAGGIGARYEVFPCADGEEAVRTLTASLQNPKPLPGFALPGGHWVLVDGFERLEGPGGPRIGDLWILHPVTDRPGPGEKDQTPPHTPTDGCGSTDQHGLLEAAYSPKAWGDLLKPLLEPTNPVYVVAVPPEPAGMAAPQVIEATDDDTLPSWLAARFPGTELHLGEAIDVKAPAELGGDYQLAPLLAADGPQHGWVMLAGGERRSIGLFSRQQPQNFFSPEETLRRAQLLFATEERPPVPETFSWRASAESASPFLPFREVTFDAERTAFVRLDRQVTSGLTPMDKVG